MVVILASALSAKRPEVKSGGKARFSPGTLPPGRSQGTNNARNAAMSSAAAAVAVASIAR